MRLTLILLSTLLLSCSVLKTTTSTSELVKILSSDSFEGREPGTIGMEKATKFVENYYESVNLKSLFKDNYRDTFKIYNTIAYNIVGVKYAKKPTQEYILIGAHLDHLGTKHSSKISKSDSIYNGANDDASGVAILLNIARNIKANQIDENIIFAVFSGEENGLIGSKHLARRLKQMNIDLKLVVNFEMLGVPLQKTPNQVYLSGFSRSNFAEISNKSMHEDFVVFNEIDEIHDLFYLADNYSFFTVFNIPSHTISTYDFENDPNYHNVKDEYENMDKKHLEYISSKMTKLIQKLKVNEIKIKD